jgi:hypothetical protein
MKIKNASQVGKVVAYSENRKLTKWTFSPQINCGLERERERERERECVCVYMGGQQ